MFTRRSRPFRRYARRVKRFVKKRYGTAGLGAIPGILRDVNMLKTAVNSERKYHDKFEYIPISVTDAAPLLIDSWGGLTEGTGEQQRIGDQIKALYTTFKVRMELNSTSTTVANTHFIRCLVIADFDTRYEAPLAATTLASYVLADMSTGQMQLVAPYNVQQRIAEGSMGERFKVLRDFRIRLDNVQSKQNIIDVTIDHKKFSQKRKGQVVRYNSTGTANYPNPRLYMLCLTDNGTVDAVQAYTYSRLCFVDT